MREHGTQLEAAIDMAIESGQLNINDTVVWIKAEGHTKARLRVGHPTEREFALELHQNSKLPERFSLQLLYKRRPARRYCSLTPHTQAVDCDEAPGQRILGKHKHRWSDTSGDECVYVPLDMTGMLIEECFNEFCAECGITFLGAWNDPPIQRELEDLR